MDHAGRRIDRYVIRGELGRGAAGVVFRAYDPLLEREVALKLLRQNDPKSLARFEREQQACTRLRHPNLAAVHAVGTTRGMPFIVMELISGQTLAELIETVGVPPPARSTAILSEVARAIAYAHAQGVLHRDLKPGNVLLDADAVPRVVDFGLASLQENDQSLTQTGALLGTPAYMSPEQAAGLRADEQSDVYGLGATLYHLLTGRPPFVDSPLLAVHRRAVDPASVHNPSVSPELDAICARALAREPADRYPSAEAFADALDDLHAEPTLTQRERPGITPLALGLVAILLASGLVWLLATRADGPQPAPAPSAASPTPAPDQVRSLLAEVDERAKGLADYTTLRNLLDRAASLAGDNADLQRPIALHRARLATRRLQRRDALEALGPLLKQPGPHQAEAFYLGATVHMQFMDHDRAKALIRRAPHDPGPWGLILKALLAKLEGDPDGMLALAREALQLQPEHPAATVLLLIALRQLKRAAEARPLLESYCSGPGRDDATALITLSSVMPPTGRRERRAELWKRAWKLCAPERSPKLVRGRAMTLLHAGEPTTALRVLEHAPSTGRGAVKLLIIRGFAHDALLDPGAARKSWRAAYRLDRKAVEAELASFQPYPLRLRLRRALALPAQVVKISPESRGLVQAILARAPSTAHEPFRKFLELVLVGYPLTRLQPRIARLIALGKSSSWVRFWLGVILAGREELDAAVPHLEASLRLEWNAEAALTLSLTLLRKGDPKRAVARLKELIGRSPDSPQGLCARAALLRLQGKPKAGVPLCDRALMSSPNHVPTLLLRSHLLADQGRRAEGLQQLKVAARAARFLDVYPMTQLAQAELELATQRRDRKAIIEAFHLAERVMATSGSPRVRLAAARASLNLPVTSPWSQGAWDWLWEARRLGAPAVRARLRPQIALASGIYLLRLAEAGRQIERARIDALLNKAAKGHAQPPAPTQRLYEKVFGAPFEPE